MIPDSTKHNPDPAYLRGLIMGTGLSQRQCAFRIGIGERTMRLYLATSGRQDHAPYPVQFALECLAKYAHD